MVAKKVGFYQKLLTTVLSCDTAWSLREKRDIQWILREEFSSNLQARNVKFFRMS